MINEIVQLTEFSEQVNIALRYLGATGQFVLTIAPVDAGKEKISPLLIKGTAAEVAAQTVAKLPDYTAGIVRPGKSGNAEIPEVTEKNDKGTDTASVPVKAEADSKKDDVEKEQLSFGW